MASVQTTAGGMPVLILKEGTKESKGKDAQKNNVTAAKLIAEIVKTSLGPRGMDKMIVEVAKSVDNEVGDGTTSSVVFAGALLEEAEELISKDVHPSVIVDGYTAASEQALKILQKIAVKVDVNDKQQLQKIARTSMDSKLVSDDSPTLSQIVVDATRQVSEKIGDNEGLKVDLDNIKVEKKAGGSMGDTKLIKGIVLDKEVVHAGMPKRVEGARIALLNSALEIEKTEMSAEIPEIVAGGGSTEAYIANELKQWSGNLEGRAQLAVQKFAEALDSIPLGLAENAGMDPIDTMTELRAKESKGSKWIGVDVRNTIVTDMFKQNVLEPVVVKEQIIKSATEAASMLLRIDDV